MTERGDEVYIEHIATAITKIRQWAPSRAEFFDDERTREAVLRKLQTMAESVQKVSDELKLSIRKFHGATSRRFATSSSTTTSA